ncbi:MAG TPA: lysylphosphatidylglycerol synthase domain-containing protein, partial [Polyangiaceae bacterium]|nr:lysylphosphatidylglycerol synthase domain-containing protein [Polyangiaceae bacterium]
MSESPAHEQRRSRAKGWVRLGLSLLVLIATLWLIDAERLWARLRTLDGRWALCALLLCWFQFLLLAARWQVVAKRLKVPLSYGRALGEYTLSTLLN